MSDRTGQQIGNFRLRKLLGSGGFADVYLGEHLYLQREHVAIKVLHTSLSSAEQQQFLQEAQTIEQFRHSGIIQIVDFGIDQRVPFMVMEYAAKGSLRDIYPRGTIVPLERIVYCTKQLAAALQYAHDQNIIHRDVKPHNFLVRASNEVILSDFGIATIAHNTTSLGTSDYVGTAAYSAPEHAEGKPRTASDQYSLATVVYEWLCGSVPFTGNTLQILAQQLTATPQPLSQRIQIYPAIEAVVMKALSKDPKQRFASVTDFANALEQAAYPPGTTLYTYRGHTDGVLTVGWSPDSKYIASGSFDNTVQVWDAATGNTILTYRGHSSYVHSAAWSPDSKYIASGSRETVKVWDSITGKTVFTYDGPALELHAVGWSPDSKYIALGRNDGTVEVHESVTWKTVLTYSPHRHYVSVITWSPDSKYIASGGYDGTVQVCDAASGNAVLIYQGHSRAVHSVGWSPDGKYIASGSADGTIHVWDAANGDTVLTDRAYSGHNHSVAWSPNGKYIAWGSSWADTIIPVLDAATWTSVLAYHEDSDEVWSLAWSPDGKHIASGGDDNTVHVWQAP